MHKQSKVEMYIETGTNQFFGIASGWMVVFYIFPLIEHLSRAEQASVASVIFFILSVLRSYWVRRYFEHRRYEKSQKLIKMLKGQEDLAKER